jgi:predicted MFS family arabinose efflux permease
MPGPIGSLRDAARGLPVTFWWLWAGLLVNRLGSFVVPFLSVYLHEVRGLSLTRASLVVSLLGVGALAAAPVGGVLADRWGRRRTLLLSTAASGALMMGLGLVSALPAIAAVVLAVGFFGDLFRPPMQAAMADLVPPARRMAAFGLTYWAVNLGWAVSQPVAGLISGWSWTALFLGDGVTTLAFAAVIWARVPETRPAAARDSREHPLAGLGRAFGDRDFRVFLLLPLLFVLLLLQALTAMPLALMTMAGVAKPTYGAISAVNGLLIVLLQPMVIRLVEKRDAAWVMAAGALLTGLGYGLFAFVSSPWAYALGVAIWTLGEIANAAVAPAVVAALAPPAHRGAYQGAWTWTFGVAQFLASAVGGAGLERIGARAFWLCCLALGVAVAAGQLSHAARLRRRLGPGGLASEAAA